MPPDTHACTSQLDYCNMPYMGLPLKTTQMGQNPAAWTVSGRHWDWFCPWRSPPWPGPGERRGCRSHGVLRSNAVTHRDPCPPPGSGSLRGAGREEPAGAPPALPSPSPDGSCWKALGCGRPPRVEGHKRGMPLSSPPGSG